MTKRSLYVYRDILKLSNLTTSEAMLLSKIVDLSILRFDLVGLGFFCRPTNEYLSEFLNYPSSVIEKYIKSLEYKEYIVIEDTFDIEEPYDRERWEFFESEIRQIEPDHSIVTDCRIGLTIKVNYNYLRNFKHAEALTFSYLDSLMKIPRYKVKKSTLAREMGKYRFQSMKHQLEKYPNLDYISRYHIHFKKKST